MPPWWIDCSRCPRQRQNSRLAVIVASQFARPLGELRVGPGRRPGAGSSQRYAVPSPFRRTGGYPRFAVRVMCPGQGRSRPFSASAVLGPCLSTSRPERPLRPAQPGVNAGPNTRRRWKRGLQWPLSGERDPAPGPFRRNGPIGHPRCAAALTTQRQSRHVDVDVLSAVLPSQPHQEIQLSLLRAGTEFDGIDRGTHSRVQTPQVLQLTGR